MKASEPTCGSGTETTGALRHAQLADPSHPPFYNLQVESSLLWQTFHLHKKVGMQTRIEWGLQRSVKVDP